MRSLIAVFLLIFGVAHALSESINVKDTIGREVNIPSLPKRIVVMSEPGIGLPLLELGISAVGSYGRADDGHYTLGADFIDTVLGGGYKKPIGIGVGGQIDLEKLHALQPDLIIGTEFDLDKIKQLSTIAPVYIQRFLTGNLDNFSIEENLSVIVDKKSAFEANKSRYTKRLQQTKQIFGQEIEGKTYLPIILMDQIKIVGEGTGVTQAFEDLGFKRLALSTNTKTSYADKKLVLPISSETLGALNPDILVVINSWSAQQQGQVGAADALNRIMPGWQDFLLPARENRIIYLDASKVFTPTFASAEHTLQSVQDWAKPR